MPRAADFSPRKMTNWLGENGFIVIFVLWALFLSLGTKSFLTYDNITTVLRQAAIIGIVAIGENLIVLLGGMDVSLASILGLSGVAAAMLTVNLGVNPFLAALIGIALGGLLGLINGLLVTKMKINPVIATLGMMSVIDGVAFTYAKGHTIFGESLRALSYLSVGQFLGLPIPVWLLFVLYGVMHWALNRTLFGAHIYALGNNEKATWLSGINIDRVKILAFVAAGLLAGFGGIMQTARQNAAMGGMGADMLFPILTAVVLGGTSLTGGKGKVLNTLIAAIFLTTINNGLIILNVSIYAQRIVSGAILISALSLDRLRNRT